MTDIITTLYNLKEHGEKCGFKAKHFSNPGTTFMLVISVRVKVKDVTFTLYFYLTLLRPVKVYCTTVCVSSATVADDAQYVEQCEYDSTTVVCPVHRSEPCDCHNWTTIGRKGRSERPGRLPRLQASTLDGSGSSG